MNLGVNNRTSINDNQSTRRANGNSKLLNQVKQSAK